MRYNSILDLIGNTPMVKLNNIVDNDMANVYVKLEYFNPAGSIKDRAAYNMINEMENRGELKKGFTIVEPTSGNTGIGMAMVASCKGYNSILVMPDTMSIERRKILSAYGAKIILTKGSEGMTGAIQKANQLVAENENYVILGQFDNIDNVNAHKKTTALEIINDLDKVDAFIAGVGTGGTITGTGLVLKEKFKDIKIVGVEPKSSAVLSGEASGAHKLQGIGAGFIPKILDTGVIDIIEKVSNEDAYDMAKKLAKEEGLLLGISSGASIYAGIKIAKTLSKDQNVVVIAPDGGDRYLSVENLY